MGFESFKESYENGADFGIIWRACTACSFKSFLIFDGFLFKAYALCVLCCSLRQTIVSEAHGGTLGGHFG